MRFDSIAGLRIDRLLGLSVRLAALAVAVFLAMLIPDLLWLLPHGLRSRPALLCWLVLLGAYVLARALLRQKRWPLSGRERIAWTLGRVDAAADLALAGWMAIIVAAACLAFLATWVPHYLLWPWDRDSDTFATLAMSWDAGILPYRDIRGYNFPGAIYYQWLLGHIFGWGPTWPLYAVDAACLVGLGFLLAAWSRRTLGSALPGLVSYLVFLTFYLSRGFQSVAARDWQTNLCIAVGLMALQAWPGRASQVISAALAAVALCFRPHAILYLPALASALLEGDGGPARRRRLAVWSLMLGAFTAAAFSPVVIAGIADDLVRGLRVATYGGPYNRATIASVARSFANELLLPQVELEIVMLYFVLAATRGPVHRRTLTWALAFGAALWYRPIHPVQHGYLTIAVELFGSISVAPSIAWLVARARVPSVYRAVLVAMIIGEVSLGWPLFCDGPATIAAIRTIARGESIPPESPPGSWVWFHLPSGRLYSWAAYRSTLLYLRETTSPGTMVANVLREPPFPALNGPTGRLSPFRAESGICWMWLVPIDLEPEFAEALEQAKDCVVVWSPGRQVFPSQLKLDRLAAVTRAHFRPEAKFGAIEVWRRADDVSRAPAAGSSAIPLARTGPRLPAGAGVVLQRVGSPAARTRP